MYGFGIRLFPAVVLGIVTSTIASSRPETLDGLDSIVGGTYTYCASEAPSGSQPCTECLSDGNGRYIKCTTPKTEEFCATGCHPNQYCVTNPAFCGGSAWRYTDPVCTVQWGTFVSCFRSYTTAANHSTPGVPCSDYCP